LNIKGPIADIGHHGAAHEIAVFVSDTSGFGIIITCAIAGIVAEMKIIADLEIGIVVKKGRVTAHKEIADRIPYGIVDRDFIDRYIDPMPVCDSLFVGGFEKHDPGRKRICNAPFIAVIIGIIKIDQVTVLVEIDTVVSPFTVGIAIATDIEVRVKIEIHVLIGPVAGILDFEFQDDKLVRVRYPPGPDMLMHAHIQQHLLFIIVIIAPIGRIAINTITILLRNKNRLTVLIFDRPSLSGPGCGFIAHGDFSFAGVISSDRIEFFKPAISSTDHIDRNTDHEALPIHGDMARIDRVFQSFFKLTAIGIKLANVGGKETEFAHIMRGKGTICESGPHLRFDRDESDESKQQDL
jgi:hypothetical protein